VILNGPYDNDDEAAIDWSDGGMVVAILGRAGKDNLWPHCALLDRGSDQYRIVKGVQQQMWIHTKFLLYIFGHYFTTCIVAKNWGVKCFHVSIISLPISCVIAERSTTCHLRLVSPNTNRFASLSTGRAQWMCPEGT